MTKKRRQARKQQQANKWLVLIALVVIIGGLGIIVSIINNAQQPATVASDTASIFERISPAEFVQTLQDDPQVMLIDVRTPAEYADGHIANSVNINVEEIASRLDEIPRDKTIVVYCRSGNRSARAAQILRNAGYNVIYDLGGIIDWQAAGFPVEY